MPSSSRSRSRRASSPRARARWESRTPARQILSPTFLVWLENHSPEAYAFELVGGSLVCNVKGHKKSASELDTLCTASAAVARRLQEEATELSGTPAPDAS